MVSHYLDLDEEQRSQLAQSILATDLKQSHDLYISHMCHSDCESSEDDLACGNHLSGKQIKALGSGLNTSQSF